MFQLTPDLHAMFLPTVSQACRRLPCGSISPDFEARL